MPPYRYDSAPNRFAPSIAEILARYGDLTARHADQVGAVQARAAEQQGQIWGNGIASIGQMLTDIPRQQRAQRESAQQQELRDLQIQPARELQAGRAAVGSMMRGDQLPPGETGPRQQSFLDGNGLFDVGKLTQALGAAGFGHLAPDLVKGAETINDSILKHQELEQKTAQAHALLIGDLADGALKLEQTGTPLLDAMDLVVQPALATQRFKPEEYASIRQHLERLPPEQQHAALDALRDQAARIAPGKTLAEGAQEVDRYGRVSASGGEKPQAFTLGEGQVRYDKDGNPIAYGPDKSEPNRTPEEHYLRAITSGDQATADRILKTIRDTADARKDPAAQGLARELAGLRQQEAQARLDALNDKNAALDIEPDVQTTRAGRRYVDLSTYTGEARNKARAAGNAAGVVGVSKEQANALQEIDNARANQQSIQDQIGDLLPKGAAGRAGAAVTVPLEKLFQTTDQISAFNSWRTAAIQTLRATAGSKGLRINQAEIAQAIENDIPKLTDTLGTAQQKMKNIQTMLENAEQSILVRDRTQPAKPLAGTVGGFSYRVRQ